MTSNPQAVNDNQVDTKSSVDQFHQNERSRRDAGLDSYNKSIDSVKNSQCNNFNDNEMTNLESVILKRNPSADNELANKKYIDDEINKNTILRFNQTPQKYLKISVGIVVYSLTKYDGKQITD